MPKACFWPKQACFWPPSIWNYNLVVVINADCIAIYPYAQWKQNHCSNNKANHQNLEEKAAVNAFDE